MKGRAARGLVCPLAIINDRGGARGSMVPFNRDTIEPSPGTL